MKFLRKDVLVTLFSFGLPVSAVAAPEVSHSLFDDVFPYDYENGNWYFGCNVYDYSNLDIDPPYDVFVNVCFVAAPGGNTGVDQYGFNFNASALVHWGTETAYPDGISQPGSWYATQDPEDVSQDIRAISEVTATHQKLKWDQLTFAWYFWYKLPNDPTYYDAGGQDSIGQTNIIGPG